MSYSLVKFWLKIRKICLNKQVGCDKVLIY